MRHIEIKPAEVNDLIKFYGASPSRTMKAIVAISDGDVLGVGGVYQCNGGWGMFSDTTEELRKHKKLLLKTAKEFVKKTLEGGLPVFAVRSEEVETSERFLRHLGFRPIDGGLYQWQG